MRLGIGRRREDKTPATRQDEPGLKASVTSVLEIASEEVEENPQRHKHLYHRLS